MQYQKKREGIEASSFMCLSLDMEQGLILKMDYILPKHKQFLNKKKKERIVMHNRGNFLFVPIAFFYVNPIIVLQIHKPQQMDK